MMAVVGMFSSLNHYHTCVHFLTSVLSHRLAVSLGPYHNWPIYFGFSYVHRYKTLQTEQAITNEERKSLHVWKWDSEREKG